MLVFLLKMNNISIFLLILKTIINQEFMETQI